MLCSRYTSMEVVRFPESFHGSFHGGTPRILLWKLPPTSMEDSTCFQRNVHVRYFICSHGSSHLRVYTYMEASKSFHSDVKQYGTPGFPVRGVWVLAVVCQSRHKSHSRERYLTVSRRTPESTSVNPGTTGNRVRTYPKPAA